MSCMDPFHFFILFFFYENAAMLFGREAPETSPDFPISMGGGMTELSSLGELFFSCI